VPSGIELDATFVLAARFNRSGPEPGSVYRAAAPREHDAWLAELEAAVETLGLDEQAASTARDLFLSTVPEERRSMRPALAASVYAGALIAGEQRSQSAVADALDVSRFSIQQRWKPLLRQAGFEPPSW